jgi:glycosyltransferase involved in cell wall biosynthesis
MSILFVHNSLTKFVQTDLEILQEHFPVRELALTSRWLPVRAIWQAVKGSRLVFGWFASWHTLLPLYFARRLNKPSVLVIGGYDVACRPEIGYGHQRRILPRIISRACMHLASQLMTNSYYSQAEAELNAGIPAARLQVIYHGLVDPFGSLPVKPVPPTILTVGNVEQDNLLRKGHLAFAQASRLLPEFPFVIAGRIKDRAGEQLKQAGGPNLRLADWLSQADLNDLYRQASVYVQASQHEGFGLSLAEAMLAGCLPVVTRIGALPEVAGETGVYIDSPTPESAMVVTPQSVAGGIRQALSLPPDARALARQKILDDFPLEKRRQALIHLVEECFL